MSRAAYVLIAAAAIVSMDRMGLLDMGELRPAAGRLWDFGTSLFPPATDVLPTLVSAMWETIQIAFVGTVLGFLLSLPLAFLATNTLFGPIVSAPARLVIGAVRTVPSLLWGVVFVVGFGLGPAAGALGVALYSVGYLGKLQYEAFEAVDTEVLEAVRGVGSNRLQLFNYAVLPEAANAVISQLLFMFEYNIRASSIMGFVGAGGIGYYMLGYLQLLQYQELLTALLVTFVVVMTIDMASMRLRALVLAPTGQRTRAPLLAGVLP
ncbi:MAG: phosphonate ABC transporter, permease protein PhnE [Dehalococcoidia bacterium]